MMITDGIQLFELYEREGPDGQSYWVGVLGGGGVVIVPDGDRAGVWGCLISDHVAGNRARASSLRTIAPLEPHHMAEMDDDLTDADFNSLIAGASTYDAPAP